MLLSIDVGIKNLAICLMDFQTKKIHNWEVACVPSQHSDGLYLALRTHLRNREWTLTADTVLIEKQPDKNKTMKSVEHFLHAYFLCNDKDVILWDARHKVPDVIGPGKTMYNKRKKTSIERCRNFLAETQPEWIPIFDEHKKKDDLADTCMQALSFKPVSISTQSTSRPRKPTENQSRTKYSKANLAWLVVNKKNTTDKRFEKDLKRYYHSFDELIVEFNLSI